MGTPCAASRAVLDQASVRWPSRNRASDGLCASSAHSAQNPTSDHEPDYRGICHAADLTTDPRAGCDVWELWNGVIARGDRRAKYLIHLRKIWNPSIAPYWRSYSGSNPHDKHGHASILTAFEDDVSDWFGETGEIMAGEADRIIATIGAYEQDTRRLLVELLDRQAVAARKVEGKRTRRLLEAIQAISEGRKVDVGKVVAQAEDDETPESVAAGYVAELELLSADLDEAVRGAKGLETRADVDQFVSSYRESLAGLAGRG